MSEYKSIKVKPDTYSKLVEKADFHTSMDDVISSLLKRVK
jgi:predicted CopG family antitoxin